MRRCTVIINPASGGYSADLSGRLRAALESRGFAVTTRETASAEDAPEFARQACLESADPLVVAVGGDGTVNGAVNGLLPGKATLAVLPAGTSNVLAREIGIFSVEEGIARIVRGETRPLPVGLLHHKAGTRYFTLMAGIGFDGAVVEGVRLKEKRVLHEGAYFLSAIRLLRQWEREKLEVVADGRRILCHSAVVCNASRYGGRFVLAPRADLFAPSFEVVCLENGSPGKFLSLAMSLAAGRVPAGCVTVSARTVLIEGEKSVQADGDFICRSPVKIESVPSFYADCRLKGTRAAFPSCMSGVESGSDSTKTGYVFHRTTTQGKA